jgi:hypothetical protein
MLLSVESPFAGAFAVHIPRAMLLLRNGLVQAVLSASRNMCKRTMEIPQELVEILSSPRQHPGWGTGLPTPGLGGALVRRGANVTSATEVPLSQRFGALRRSPGP